MRIIYLRPSFYNLDPLLSILKLLFYTLMRCLFELFFVVSLLLFSYLMEYCKDYLLVSAELSNNLLDNQVIDRFRIDCVLSCCLELMGSGCCGFLSHCSISIPLNVPLLLTGMIFCPTRTITLLGPGIFPKLLRF